MPIEVTGSEAISFISDLYERTKKDLMNHCLVRYATLPCRSQLAEDTVQTVFRIAIESYSDLATHKNPEAWLFLVCKREIYRTYAKEKKNIENCLPFTLLHDMPIPEQIDCLREMIEKSAEGEILRRKSKQFLTECEYEVVDGVLNGKTVTEFSQAKGITEQAARMRLQRAKDKLSRLAEEGHFDNYMIFFVFITLLTIAG